MVDVLYPKGDSTKETETKEDKVKTTPEKQSESEADEETESDPKEKESESKKEIELISEVKEKDTDSPKMESKNKQRESYGGKRVQELRIEEDGGQGTDIWETEEGNEQDQGFLHKEDLEEEGEMKTTIKNEESTVDIKTSTEEETDEKKKLRSRSEKIKSWFNKQLQKIIKYYKELFSEEDKIGADYYVIIFLLDIISMIFLALWPNSFIGPTDSITEVFSSSVVPLSFLAILLFQFLLIVVERMVYLYRAILIKTVMLYCSVVFYTIMIIIYLPWIETTYFSLLPTLVLFFLLKIIYFAFSALQIRNGYPKRINESLFEASDKNPTLLKVQNIIISIYRAIPFLYELRTILDWAITRTSLALDEWFKLEDIYAELFSAKSRIVDRQNTERRVGDPQLTLWKVIIGGGFFLGLVVVIWSPLLVFTQGPNSSNTNLVVQVTFRLGVGGYANMYSTQQMSGISILDSNRFLELYGYYRNAQTEVLFSLDDNPNTQEISLEPWSHTPWFISEPSRINLIEVLSTNETTLWFLVQISFTLSAGNTMTWKNDNGRVITPIEKSNLLAMLLNEQVNHNYSIEGLFPRVYHLPRGLDDLSQIPLVSNEMVDIHLKLSNVNTSSFSSYWNLTQSFTNNLFYGDHVKLLVITTPTSTWIPASIAVLGIMGIYTVYVLAVGRILRPTLSGQSLRIIYEDMPYVDDLLGQCKDIILARQDGLFTLEEELYRELVELYRSPERLIKWTVPKGPMWKEPKPKKKKQD